MVFRRMPRAATGLGALGVATAVGLAGTVATAEPAAAHPTGANPNPSTRVSPIEPRTNGVASHGRYTVVRGDTVSAIAARFKTTIPAIVAANGLNSRAMIYIGQVLTIPGASAAVPAATTARPPSSPAPATHTVAAGDTLSAIALRYKTTVAALTKLNNLRTTIIFPGQRLTVAGNTAAPTPAPAPATTTGASYTVRAGDTVSAIAARHGTTVSAIVAANRLNSSALIRIGQKLTIPGQAAPSSTANAAPPTNTAATTTTSASTTNYTVRTGDTLSGIASRHGTTVAALTSHNGLSSTVIYPGQQLRVPKQLVPSTFLTYTYSADVVAAANANKHTLLAADLPSAAQMQQIIRTTAVDMGVDPSLALAVAYQESGFNPTAVSPANAVGVMQVIPSSGEWASDLVGRDLNLLDPHDNVVAGVAILRTLVKTAPDLPTAIASYYQGYGSVSRNGMFADTRRYVANVQTLMTRFA